MVGRVRAPNRDAGQVPKRTGRRHTASPVVSAYAVAVPASLRQPQRRQGRVVVLTLALSTVLAGCLGAAGPEFDPAGPCVVDGSAEGAYPELETAVPPVFEGRGPDRLDSGRNCTSDNLGSLAALGIAEARFAGGIWDFGNDQAAVLVVFDAPGLTAPAIAEFYETSAGTSNRTQVVATSTPTVAGRPAARLDTKTGERLQTVVVWENRASDRVNVVITHNLPEGKIVDATEAFGDR